MNINKVKLVCFSPTGTTRKVLSGIAQGLGAEELDYIDLTLPDQAQKPVSPFADELVIIGAPVYGGRLPQEAVKRFEKIQGVGTPAVAVVVYGNREFEDSLLELKDLAEAQGFKPLAGAAFIGEHSFATKDLPVANGRPDDKDLEIARDFGAKIKAKLAAPAGDQAALEIPGRFPYEGGARAMAVSPVTKEDVCILCGTCAAVCPTGAITVEDDVTTQIPLCIRCTACVKNCPTEARVWDSPDLLKIATWLNENCGTRKEPQLFGVD